MIYKNLLFFIVLTIKKDKMSITDIEDLIIIKQKDNFNLKEFSKRY
jgi:hypothetical protein